MLLFYIIALHDIILYCIVLYCISFCVYIYMSCIGVILMLRLLPRPALPRL